MADEYLIIVDQDLNVSVQNSVAQVAVESPALSQQVQVVNPALPTTVTVESTGIPGPPGQGVPAGGTGGQALAKIDATDFNTEWVTLPTGHTIQEEGVDVAQRARLNFIGSGVTVTDNGGSGATDVTIASGVVDHGALTGLTDDDHAQYALADGTRGNFEPTGTAASAVSAHEAAVDPHAQYLTQAEADALYEDTGAVAAHVADLDPHTQYQKESEKGAANGYASLGADTKVPIAEVPTGTTGTTVALGDHLHTGVYDASGTAAAAVAAHEALPDPHTQYLTAAEGDAAYDAIGAASSAVTSHEAALDPHPVYLEPDEIIAGANITVDLVTTPGSAIISASGTGGGHTVQDEGTPLTTRSNLNFVGGGVVVTDDAGNDATVVTVSSPDTVITIATDDTPSDLAAQADYVVPGSNAHTAIQAVIDTLTSGGELVFLPGTYDIAATLIVRVERVSLRFTTDAVIRWLGVTGRTPLLQIVKSNVFVWNPEMVGSGSKGNGIGIQIGGNGLSEQAGDQPGGVHVYLPRLDNLDTGLEFGVQPDGTQSSGDNTVWGGRISDCKVGIRNAGFVNYVYSPFISGCDVGIMQTDDRYSGRIVVDNATINQWGIAAVQILRGRGSTFRNLWMEHTAVQTSVATKIISIEPVGGDVVINPTFEGIIHIHPLDSLVGTEELYGVYLDGEINGALFNHLEFTEELPSTSLIRLGPNYNGASNRINRVSFGNDPIGYSNSTDLLTADVGATGTIDIYEIPDETTAGIVIDNKNFLQPSEILAGTNVTVDTVTTPGSVIINSTAAGGTTTLDTDYYMTVSGSPNSATYTVLRRNGSTLGTYADTGTTSGLKAAFGAILGEKWDNTSIMLGPGRFHYLDAPVGNESWAGVEDHAVFGSANPPLVGLAIIGSGRYNTILSNRTAYTAGTDTEPLSFTNAQNVYISDLTIEGCGPARTTTDAIDFDQGRDCIVERVRITKARARGIVVDGGDAGKHGDGLIVNEVEVHGRPERSMLSLLSGGSLTASTTYRYCVAYTDADLGGAQVAADTKPGDVSEITTDSTNRTIRMTLPIGPYTTTARKIFRQTASGSWQLLTTINNNTDTFFSDTGALTPSAASFNHSGTNVPGTAIEVLGGNNARISNCLANGTGVGFKAVRKNTSSPSNRNVFDRCIARHTVSYGFYVVGGSDNLFINSQASNAGTVAAKAHLFRVEGVTGVLSDRNKVISSRLYDDQTSLSPSGGLSVNNVISITSTNAPTNNAVLGNSLSAGAGAMISDSGTTTMIRNNVGLADNLDHGSLIGLADDDHTQYGIIVVSGTEPSTPRVGTIWVPTG